jgi:hypothetical protein
VVGLKAGLAVDLVDLLLVSVEEVVELPKYLVTPHNTPVVR